MSVQKLLVAYANWTKSFSTCPLLNHIIKNYFTYRKLNQSNRIILSFRWHLKAFQVPRNKASRGLVSLLVSRSINVSASLIWKHLVGKKQKKNKKTQQQQQKNTNRGLFSVTAWKRRAPSPLALGFSVMSQIWRGVGILPGMHTLRTTALQNCLKTIASAGVGANSNSQFCPWDLHSGMPEENSTQEFASCLRLVWKESGTFMEGGFI